MFSSALSLLTLHIISKIPIKHCSEMIVEPLNRTAAVFWGCWVMLCYLELRFGLLLVHRELREWLLQRAGLGRVILPLLLQDFSPLLVVFEPEGKTQSNREREIKEFHQFLVIFFVGRKKTSHQSSVSVALHGHDYEAALAQWALLKISVNAHKHTPVLSFQG